MLILPLGARLPERWVAFPEWRKLWELLGLEDMDRESESWPSRSALLPLLWLPILILDVPSPADSLRPVMLSAVAEGIVGRVPKAMPAGEATRLEPNWGDADGERDLDRLS
jgi:hypothetical protein